MAGVRAGLGRAGPRVRAPVTFGLALIAAVSAGCGGAYTSGLLEESPTEAELARLKEWDRAGVMCRVAHVKRGLRRELPRFLPSLDEARDCGYVDGPVRMAYLPLPGKGIVPVMNLASIRGGGNNPLEPGLVWWMDLGYMKKWIPGLTLDALKEARRKSAFHRPVRARIGKLDCWAICETLRYGKPYGRCATAEIYPDDPNGPAAPGKPAYVLVLAWTREGKRVKRDMKLPFSFRGGLYRLLEVKREGGRLVSLAADEWTPDIDDVISGKTGFLVKVMPHAQAISYLNDFLLTWKTKGLPDRLRTASVEDLGEFAIRLEKSMLRYDMASKRSKDAAQVKLAKGESADSDLRIARLFDQRQVLLRAILISTRKALAVRRR